MLTAWAALKFLPPTQFMRFARHFGVQRQRLICIESSWVEWSWSWLARRWNTERQGDAHPLRGLETRQSAVLNCYLLPEQDPKWIYQAGRRTKNIKINQLSKSKTNNFIVKRVEKFRFLDSDTILTVAWRGLTFIVVFVFVSFLFCWKRVKNKFKLFGV